MVKAKEKTANKEALYGGELKFWQVCAKPNLGGRPRKFSSPQELLDGALAYFKYIDEHPWQIKSANQALHENGNGKATGVSQNTKVKQRAYTLFGILAFLGCSTKWGDLKRSYKDIEGFLAVFTWIESVVTSQQVEGAMLRQFDGNLVARLNGLADIQVNQVSMDDSIPKLTEEDIEKLRMINGYKP